MRWELGDSTPPPFNNVGPGTMCSGPLQSSLPNNFDDANMGGGSGTGSGGGGGGGAGTTGSGGIGKEVRYAPFPIPSPTSQPNFAQMSQAPLQRAHSR